VEADHPPLRLGYDAKRLFQNFTGLGNYSRTLLRNLVRYYPTETYHLFTPKVVSNTETQFFQQEKIFHVHTPQSRFRNYWRTFSVKDDSRKHQIQLYHGLSHEIPLGLPKTGIKSVVTIHDLVFKHYPTYFPFIDRQVYDAKFRYSCKNADAVVAISKSTKEDIMHFYDIPAEKIEVIYQTCHDRFKTPLPEHALQAVMEQYELPENFMLYVGSIIPRKNLLGIVKAMSMMPKDFYLPLVVIGSGTSYKKKVLQHLRKHRLEKYVHFPKVRYEDLPALYQQAEVFLYPSYYEGFGIPIIEALYSQTPVLTTNVSSLPEAAGPGAHYVHPEHPSEIAEGIKNILNDSVYREQLVEEGYAYVQQFDSEPTTQAMMELYRKVLAGEK